MMHFWLEDGLEGLWLEKLLVRELSMNVLVLKFSRKGNGGPLGILVVLHGFDVHAPLCFKIIVCLSLILHVAF